MVCVMCELMRAYIGSLDRGINCKTARLLAASA